MHSVELEVEAGAIYGFLGPNGAGNSTNVKMLCTLISPTGGSAQVAGFYEATQATDLRLRIGVASQSSALDPKQTGRDLLDLQDRYQGLNKTDRARRVQELSGLFDIGDALDRRTGAYSDVIIATVASDIDRAEVVAATVDSCGPVEIHGPELTIVTSNGAASIGPVAIALAAAGITVTSMTLRRPTLDDVFLELTGAHL